MAPQRTYMQVAAPQNTYTPFETQMRPELQLVKVVGGHQYTLGAKGTDRKPVIVLVLTI